MAKGFDERGREIPDPTPVEMPVGYRRPESLQEMMRRFIRTELSASVADQGFETFEESNDFDVPGEDLPLTDYEMQAEVPIEAGGLDRFQEVEGDDDSGVEDRSRQRRKDDGADADDDGPPLKAERSGDRRPAERSEEGGTRKPAAAGDARNGGVSKDKKPKK